MIVIYALVSAHGSQSTSLLSRNSHVRMGRAKLDMSDLIDSNTNLFVCLIEGIRFDTQKVCFGATFLIN